MRKSLTAFAWTFLPLLLLIGAPASVPLSEREAIAREKPATPLECSTPKATRQVNAGFEAQADGNTDAALKHYQACLKSEPECVPCLYEIGWSYWKRGSWEEVIATWQKVLKIQPGHARAKEYLPTARENLAIVRKKNKIEVFRSETQVLTRSTPDDSPVQMTFVGRRQSYNREPASPLDHYDPDIDSPKSALFSPDGKTVYVNSLEAGETLAYDTQGLEKKAVVRHRFTEQDRGLFEKKAPFDYRFPKKLKKPNVFVGKPVEGVITHEGRYLWTTYYRRNYDAKSQYPSAVAVIDTRTHKILRVLGTGPISKYIQVSPDGKRIAISNWGDNTVGLYDISSDRPRDFKAIGLLTVESRLNVKNVHADRDHDCGFCVRGLAFSADSRYLFVGRMRKGGLAVFDLTGEREREPASSKPEKPVYLGTVFGINPGPRDLQTDPSGKWLYSSCNASGYISKIPMDRLLGALPDKRGGSVRVEREKLGVVSAFAGTGVRSIKLSPDGRYVFAAVNQGSELMAFRTEDMKVVSRIPVDSFPVGLAVSPDGTQLWVTSQGRKAKGGNSVGIYQIRYRDAEMITEGTDPRRNPENP